MLHVLGCGTTNLNNIIYVFLFQSVDFNIHIKHVIVDILTVASKPLAHYVSKDITTGELYDP